MGVTSDLLWDGDSNKQEGVGGKMLENSSKFSVVGDVIDRLLKSLRSGNCFLCLPLREPHGKECLEVLGWSGGGGRRGATCSRGKWSIGLLLVW
jgi:hypothetical protein